MSKELGNVGGKFVLIVIDFRITLGGFLLWTQCDHLCGVRSIFLQGDFLGDGAVVYFGISVHIFEVFFPSDNMMGAAQ